MVTLLTRAGNNESNAGAKTVEPLFVTRDYGRGRVFFSATDETYRWRFMRGDSPYFYPFWQRAINWASGK